jgi:hypothetical protein
MPMAIAINTRAMGATVRKVEIVKELKKDPAFLLQVPGYERDGWPEVVLTPRSG